MISLAPHEGEANTSPNFDTHNVASIHGRDTGASPLTRAIQAADLPAIIAAHYPDARAQPGRAGRVLCVWRGGNDLSGAIFRGRDGRWRLQDHVLTAHYDAYSFLVEVLGFSLRDAAQKLLRDAGLDGAPRRYTARPPRAPGIEATVPDDLPGELLAYHALGLSVDFEGARFGAGNLEALAFWIADSVRPVFGWQAVIR
jgi:hypothetical protein